MWCFKFNKYTAGIIIAVWTVVQTGFHILWTLIGYFFYKCKIKPSHYWLVMLYLTYFYNDDCGKIDVQNGGIFINLIDDLEENSNNETDLYNIVKEIVAKADFPKEAASAQRTINYLFVFLLVDVLWIVSAFLLFVGTLLKVKKRLSLLFFTPWLAICAIICIMDVAAAVHFGVDLLRIKNYSSLLNFIGIKNYVYFKKFDEYEGSHFVPTEFTSLLCLLFARFLIVWITNIINFSQIINVAIFAYQDMHIRNEAYPKSGRRTLGRSGLEDSESRIRTWQLFYGAIEITSTISGEVSKRDRNSNEKPKKHNVRIDPVPIPIDDDSPVSTIDTHQEKIGDTSGYRRFSDISLPPLRLQNLRKPSIDSLRGHLPWSYTENHTLTVRSPPFVQMKPFDQHNSSTSL